MKEQKALRGENQALLSFAVQIAEKRLGQIRTEGHSGTEDFGPQTLGERVLDSNTFRAVLVEPRIPHAFSGGSVNDFIAMECRPWDGRDDSPFKLSSVKLDMDVVESARIVAAYHPYKTMSDLLSEILRPILTRMEQEAVEDRAKRPRRAKGQKP